MSLILVKSTVEYQSILQPYENCNSSLYKEKIKRDDILHLPLALQVKHLLNAIDQTRINNVDACVNNSELWIRTTKHKKNVVSDCRNFVSWILNQNSNATIESLNENDYIRYLSFVESKNVSNGHLVNIETSLRLLQGAMTHLKVGMTFCTRERLYTSNSKESVSNRAYTDEEIASIRKYASDEACKAINLMLNLGLIVQEAVNIRAEHFVVNENGITLSLIDGQGVSRGGCSRFIQVPAEFETDLIIMLKDKHGYDKLINMKVSGVRNAINKACIKANIPSGRGCNGFRHSFARNRINSLLNESELEMLEVILNKMRNLEGNFNVKQGRIDKGFKGESLVTFKELREKLMIVLGELGCNNYKTMWHMALRYYN
ncbi:hypothetical protein ABC382_00810 [Lysinibacillus sp. 1P01SD]|uniref:hypothetical protein n=1 Tax=Lysinibacillus sp. 1P01SD TaxID=3132285 RepID=UPI0039A0FBF8